MITIFEGPDLIGKTTLAKNYASALNCYYTFEPFGETKEQLALRQMALTKDVDMLSREYMLLANRCLGYAMISKLIPDGINIVTDRSYISGMVYANMEGMSFQEWNFLFQPLIDRFPRLFETPPIVVLCSNKEMSDKIDIKDRYDGRPIFFHRLVYETFHKALKFLGIKYINFEISFNVSGIENCERLISLLQNDARDNGGL